MTETTEPTYHAHEHTDDHQGVDCAVVENRDLDAVVEHFDPPDALEDATDRADLLNEAERQMDEGDSDD